MTKTQSTTAQEGSTPSRSWPMGLQLFGLLLILVAERVVVDSSTHVLVGWLGAGVVLAATVWRTFTWRRAFGRTRQAERWLWLGQMAVLLSVVLLDLQSEAGLTALGLHTGGSGGTGSSASGFATTAIATTGLTALWLVVMSISVTASVAMERAWMAMPVAAAVEPRRLRSASFDAMILAFSLLFAFGINYTVTRRDIKKDVTFFKTTDPSATTTAMVKRLEERLTVVLFFPPTSDVLPQVKPYFDSLASLTPQLVVQVRDHALEPALAQRFRVPDNGYILLVRGDLSSAKKAADDGTPPHKRIEIGEGLEQIRRAVRKLDATFQQRFSKLTRAPRRVRFTAGHHERSKDGEKTDRAGDHLLAVHRLLERFNIGSDSLGLGDGLGNAVPAGTTAVLSMGPRRRFLEEEAQSLIRYVEAGGRLMLLVDPAHDAKQDGLDGLLQYFGVQRLPGTVASQGHHMRSTYTKADHALIYSNTFSSHPSVSSASRNSVRVAAVMARGVAFKRTAKPPRGVVVTFPIRSTADFWRDLDGNLVRDANEPLGRLNLMVTVQLPPPRRSRNGAKTPKNQPNSGKPAPQGGRIVIVGDGDFATDALIKTSGNALIFVDSLRWLIGEQHTDGGVSSEEDVPIEHRKDADRLWFYLTTFGLPLPLLLLGLWIGRRRRSGGR